MVLTSDFYHITLCLSKYYIFIFFGHEIVESRQLVLKMRAFLVVYDLQGHPLTPTVNVLESLYTSFLYIWVSFLLRVDFCVWSRSRHTNC